RLSGGLLLVERTGASAITRSIPVDGSTLAAMAAVVGVDLSSELDVGGDTPELGDIDVPLSVDPSSLTQIGTWFAYGLQVLDRVVAQQPTDAAPTRARIWPEHFDLGIDLAVASGGRVNLGASPGDGFHAAPYLYVSPWTGVPANGDGYWNAPFGAVLGYAEIAVAPSAFAFGVDFLERGLALLA
ncbi:MAG: hypothetical protein JWL72_861, partial [Ilumatobacteraceae bacterium]|nr:hypothetical protein [Ilumatobacteraceae bacterium]